MMKPRAMQIVRATAACKLPALALCALLSSPLAAEPAPPHLPSDGAHTAHAAGQLLAKRSPKNPQTVILRWHGPVRNGMSQAFIHAFQRYKSTSRRFLLELDSPGGSVAEGERVISELQRIRATHKLDTLVKAGGRCASMCSFIFAQGQRRYAAPASLWLFHEASTTDAVTHKTLSLNRKLWLTLIDKYLVPIGVSPVWIKEVTNSANRRNYWISGDGLIAKNSGLVTHRAPDVVPRSVAGIPTKQRAPL